MELSKPAVFFCSEEIIEVRREELNRLKQAAAKAPLKRARMCLHRCHSDKVQEMIIAFCGDSYVRPHRHVDKSESFHVIEGELLVVIFDDKGHVTRRIKMGPFASGLTFFYRLAGNLWHMVVPLSEFIVLHEAAAGPFVKDESDFAVWAPGDEDKEGIKSFIPKVTRGIT